MEAAAEEVTTIEQLLQSTSLQRSEQKVGEGADLTQKVPQKKVAETEA